jgi:hypothetical protein
MADTSFLTPVALGEICSIFGEIVSSLISTIHSPSFPLMGFKIYRIEYYVHGIELGSGPVLKTVRAP